MAPTPSSTAAVHRRAFFLGERDLLAEAEEVGLALEKLPLAGLLGPVEGPLGTGHSVGALVEELRCSSRVLGRRNARAFPQPQPRSRRPPRR